jgi:hypothetical protein
MKRNNPKVARLEELKAMLAAYRRMTVEEVESSGWGDMEIELEGEVWLLEQELLDEAKRHPAAA